MLRSQRYATINTTKDGRNARLKPIPGESILELRLTHACTSRMVRLEQGVNRGPRSLWVYTWHHQELLVGQLEHPLSRFPADVPDDVPADAANVN
jgi:hypothetical protein